MRYQRIRLQAAAAREQTQSGDKAMKNLSNSKSIAAGSSCRSFDKARTAKGLFGAAMSIATLTASLAVSPALHAQSVAVSFAGVQSILPLQGLGEVTGIVMDETGNLYIADDTHNCIWEVSPTGVQIQLPISAGTVTQLAVDSGGKLFILDPSNNQVIRQYNPANGSLSTLLRQGIGSAQGLAVDHHENVIYDDPNFPVVGWYPYSGSLGGGGYVTPNQATTDPFNLAVGPYNSVTGTQYLFIVDAGSSELGSSQVYAVEESFNSSGPSFNWSGETTLTMQELTPPYTDSLKNASGVAVDYAGNVFITDTGNNRVVEWPISSTNSSGGESFSSAVQLPVSGLSSPYGVTTDAKGNLYIADRNNSRVVEMQMHSVNFGAVNACQSGQTSPAPCSYTIPVTFNVTASGNLGTPQLYVPGGLSGSLAKTVDFSLASGSTCKGAVTAGSTCTVNVTFSPRYPGLRTSSVWLTDAYGDILATLPVYGTGLAPLVAFSQAPQSLARIPLSVTNPTSVVLDAAGNFFVAEASGTILKLASNTQQIVASGLSSTLSLAVDGADNLYVADRGNNRVLKFTEKLAQSTVGSGLSLPTGVAVDGEDNVYIADTGNNRVVEVPVAGPQFTINTNGLIAPMGVAVDGLGDVFIADTINQRVVEVSVYGPQNTISSGLSNPVSLTVDAGGDVYVADIGLDQVVEITPSGVQTTIGTGLQLPYSVALDGAGDVFIADWQANRIDEVQQSQPPAFNFGSLAVETVSAPQSVTVQNIGNQPLNASGLSVSGSNFEQVEGTTSLQYCYSNISLAGGAGCTLSVIFWPPSTGSFSGSAVLTDNTSNSTSASQTIKLTGSGTN
jgi:large repetitive protein